MAGFGKHPSLERQNFESDQAKAHERERALEFDRRQERERERAEERQAEQDREDREREEEDSDACASEQAGQTYRELLRNLPTLSGQVSELSERRDAAWIDVARVGCSIRTCEQLLDFFNYSDSQLVRQLTELRVAVDRLSLNNKTWPSIDSVLEHGGKVCDLVGEAHQILDRDFLSSIYFSYGDFAEKRGGKRSACPVTLATYIRSNWPKDISRLAEALRVLSVAVSHLSPHAFVVSPYDEAMTVAPWMMDLFRLHTYKTLLGNEPDFLKRRVDMKCQLLTAACSAEASKIFLGKSLQAGKACAAPYVAEVTAQAEIIESLGNNPSAINGVLDKRSYKVVKFCFYPESPPTGLSGLIFKFNGGPERERAKLNQFIGRVKAEASDLAAAFSGLESEPSATDDLSSVASSEVTRSASLDVVGPDKPVAPVESATQVKSALSAPEGHAARNWMIIACAVLCILLIQTWSTRRPTSHEAATGTAVLATAASPSKPAEISDVSRQLSTLRNFYLALARGDGIAASQMVVPEKRATGAFSADRITDFYANLTERLQLEDLASNSDGTISVHYRFKARNRICKGRAAVTTVERAGDVLIQRIRPLDGC